MKRAPFPYPKVPETPEEAHKYAESAAKRGTRIGKHIARQLAKGGFEEGTILDIGCGSGEVLIEIARAFPKAELVGLDQSEPLLEIARSSTEKACLSNQLKFKKGDAQAIPFEDNSFDVVVSVNTFHVVDDPIAMLNEIERVLKPEGILGLSCIKRSWLGVFMPILRTAYTVSETKEILQCSNLRPWKLHDSLLWYIIEGA